MTLGLLRLAGGRAELVAENKRLRDENARLRVQLAALEDERRVWWHRRCHLGGDGA